MLPYKFMALLALLLSLVIWGVIFYILWWALGAIALPEPFNKVAVVVLVIAAVIVVIGILTGSVAPFPVIAGL